MDLLYIGRKLVAELARPSTLLVIVFVATTTTALFVARNNKWLRVSAAVSGGALLLVCFSPVSNWLLASLERRYAPFQSTQLESPPSAIVVLGGMSAALVVGGGAIVDLKDAVDRVRYASILAHLYPQASVIVSGGGDGPFGPESKVMADLLTDLGIVPTRITLEARSRTTAENARYVREIVRGDAAVLLVTSASHMPRAMANFESLDLNVIAAPTDWQVSDGESGFFNSASASLSKLDLAAHEYLGLLALRIFGSGSGQ